MPCCSGPPPPATAGDRARTPAGRSRTLSCPERSARPAPAARPALRTPGYRPARTRLLAGRRRRVPVPRRQRRGELYDESRASDQFIDEAPGAVEDLQRAVDRVAELGFGRNTEQG